MRLAIIALTGFAAIPAGAEPAGNTGPAIEVSTGVEYQEGDYGTGQKVRSLTAPATIRVRKGRVEFSSSLPYVRLDAPGNVVGGGGLLGLPILVDPNRPPQRQRREGLGDARVGASYDLPVRGVGLTVSAQAKLPTASRRKGLGTGEVDYAMGAELSKRVGALIPFVGVGYTMPGDPRGFALRDSLSVRGGAAAQLGKTVRAQVSYGHAQSVSRLVPDQKQVATGVDAGLSQRLSLGAYGAAGVSKGSPDVVAGVRLGVRLR